MVRGAVARVAGRSAGADRGARFRLRLATARSAADRIRIASRQKTGTLAWELDIIKTRGLDKAADLDIQVVELASTEAGRSRCAAAPPT